MSSLWSSAFTLSSLHWVHSLSDSPAALKHADQPQFTCVLLWSLNRLLLFAGLRLHTPLYRMARRLNHTLCRLSQLTLFVWLYVFTSLFPIPELSGFLCRTSRNSRLSVSLWKAVVLAAWCQRSGRRAGQSARQDPLLLPLQYFNLYIFG
jgi:hypothetical protein